MAKQGVYLRNTIWWIRYTGVDGHQIRESSGSKKQKEAEALLNLRKHQVMQGIRQEQVKVNKNYTFWELAEKYLGFVANQRAIRSKKIIVEMLCDRFRSLPIRNFTLELVERFQSEILLKGLSGATTNRRIAILKHMFTKAGDWRMVSVEVVKEVHRTKMLKENNRRDRFLSKDEIRRLLDACGDRPEQRHLKPVIFLALNTGCRKDEILSLEWEQVDLAHGIINLEQTKNNEKRRIPINQSLRKMLEIMYEQRDANVPYVFYDSASGKRFVSLQSSFNTAVKKAGISNFKFHDLRHTFASHLVMSGVDLTTVSRLLGHKTLTMTLRYSHLAPNHLSNAMESLAGALAIE